MAIHIVYTVDLFAKLNVVTKLIYFDHFDSWQKSFEELLVPILGVSKLEDLGTSNFMYIEDAGDFVVNAAGIGVISSALFEWFKRNDYRVFHGTRLLPEELASIRNDGLQPLMASERVQRLEKIFGSHRRWAEVKGRLRSVIEDVGPKGKQGDREGQVHFSLSKIGLLQGFDHYVSFGSEFDQHVAARLFDDDTGKLLLREKTTPYVVHVRMNGTELVSGAHPIINYQDIVERGEVPDVGLTFLNAWAYKKSKPEYDLDKLRTDCCMVQKHSTALARIERIELLHS